MVIPEEVVSSRDARVSLEYSVCVQPANDRWRSCVLASLPGLSSDAEEVGDEVAVDEVGAVGDESGSGAVHVEPFLNGLDDLGWSGDSITGQVLTSEH